MGSRNEKRHVLALESYSKSRGSIAACRSAGNRHFRVRFRTCCRVKKNPEDYEAVLLTATFHVEPFPSDQLRKVLVASMDNDAKDPIEEAKAIQEKVLQALVAICKEHLKDDAFSKLFNKENQLIPVVAKAFQETIKTYEAKGWLEGLLVDALLKKDISGEFEFGKSFALTVLPDEIAEHISEAGCQKRIMPG